MKASDTGRTVEVMVRPKVTNTGKLATAHPGSVAKPPTAKRP
jgi:hypothetical protein